MLTPWSIDAWQGRVAIRHEDMPEDTALELVGDFGSEQQRMDFAKLACLALTAADEMLGAKPIQGK